MRRQCRDRDTVVVQTEAFRQYMTDATRKTAGYETGNAWWSRISLGFLGKREYRKGAIKLLNTVTVIY